MNLKDAMKIPKYRLEELAVLNDERIRELEARFKEIENGRADLVRFGYYKAEPFYGRKSGSNRPVPKATADNLQESAAANPEEGR